MADSKIVLIMEYDGTRYCGFQFQPDAPTIQDETEKAIFRLTGEKKRIIGASRTDSGVHACGQVVSFFTDSPLPVRSFVHGLNYYLPVDISIKAAYRVSQIVDIRRNALSREYRYYIVNSGTRSPLRRSFAHRTGELDIDAMNRACARLVGEHDFASFASQVDGNLRTVRRVHRAEVTRKGDMAVFAIKADSFLPHQVRNTVGSLVRVGQGRLSLEDFCHIIEARKPGSAGPMAPACGLFLVHIDYPTPWSEN